MNSCLEKGAVCSDVCEVVFGDLVEIVAKRREYTVPSIPPLRNVTASLQAPTNSRLLESAEAHDHLCGLQYLTDGLPILGLSLAVGAPPGTQCSL